MVTESYCYVAFKIADLAAFQRLTAVVDELRRDKDSFQRNLDDAHWLHYFQESDRAEFWWPAESEAQAWEKFWHAAAIPSRNSGTLPTPPWDFGAMVEAIFQGDYELIGVRRIGEELGRLEINPHGYPYGGIGSLRTLVRAFGHDITGYDEGFGFVAGDERGSRWTPSMKPPKSGALGILDLLRVRKRDRSKSH